MEAAHFIFWEALKVVCLAFLGLLAVKTVGSLRASGNSAGRRGVRSVLYLVIAGLCAAGAWAVGFDTAAEVYFWGSGSYLEKGQAAQAYLDALRAVQLRPGNLQYWRALAASKLSARQFESLLADQPAFQQLSGGALDENDEYDFLLCHFYLGHYEQAVKVADHLIDQNRGFAAPYVVRGMTLIAEKKYPEAERTFLSVLQFQPGNGAAVEGLAHVYFLTGQRQRAVAVLNETAKFSFPAELRRRFEALKGLYGQ